MPLGGWSLPWSLGEADKEPPHLGSVQHFHCMNTRTEAQTREGPASKPQSATIREPRLASRALEAQFKTSSPYNLEFMCLASSGASQETEAVTSCHQLPGLLASVFLIAARGTLYKPVMSLHGSPLPSEEKSKSSVFPTSPCPRPPLSLAHSTLVTLTLPILLQAGRVLPQALCMSCSHCLESSSPRSLHGSSLTSFRIAQISSG